MLTWSAKLKCIASVALNTKYVILKSHRFIIYLDYSGVFAYMGKFLDDTIFVQDPFEQPLFIQVDYSPRLYWFLKISIFIW